MQVLDQRKEVIHDFQGGIDVWVRAGIAETSNSETVMAKTCLMACSS